ncbi:hypothetical protein JCM5350_007582 [Sporobolomyces pararoseus]
MSLQLPPELLRLVVDNFRLPPFSTPRRTLDLEEETRSTLSTLSLTSRSFREIAQPLLFDFIRIPNFETLFCLVGNNARNGRLLFTRSILYEGKPVDEQEEWEEWEQREEEESLRLFRELSTCADRVEELIVYNTFYRVQSIFSLKRLFLSSLKLDAVPTMPHLEILGLYNVYMDSASQVAQSFASVRHLTFDSGGREIPEDQALFLTCLASQLDTIELLSDVYPNVLSKVPSLPVASILVTSPWNWWPLFRSNISSMVNIRLNVSDIYEDTTPVSTCSEWISELATQLCQRGPLETLYLPPIDSLPSAYGTESIISSLQQLSLKLQERNIEVVYEEQSDQIEGERQISEEFMRRMTRKRIEREAKLSKEE